MTDYIAPYIMLSEYKCTHCSSLPPDIESGNISQIYHNLFERFAMIRAEWGRPITISSGYRCPVYNQIINGEPLSIHQFGLALDLDLPDAQEVSLLADIINDKCPELRMGVYKASGTFIHIDNGYEIKPRASWKWREGARWTG